MPTLRELTGAIRRRPGVQTVVILGADGLVIETSDDARDGGADPLAARVPAVLAAARQLGEATGGGGPESVIIEFEGGFAVALRLSAQAVLLVCTSRDAALGELLFDLRQHRAPMAALL